MLVHEIWMLLADEHMVGGVQCGMHVWGMCVLIVLASILLDLECGERPFLNDS